jgi:hypothetical protein
VNTVAFGDLDAGVWGAVWGPVAIVATPDGELGDASLSDDGSTISGAGIELTLTPHGEASETEDGSSQQLCRVHGRIVRDGAEHELDCLGRRGASPEPALGDLQAVRELSAWFEPEDGVYLSSSRPRKAKGHDSDVVAATLFDEGHPLAVEEPRVSTTYDVRGLPARVTLELWLGGDDEEEQYPRRLAAEALGAPVTRELGGGPTLEVTPMRWHFRGRDGAGVYLLVRPA